MVQEVFKASLCCSMTQISTDGLTLTHLTIQKKGKKEWHHNGFNLRRVFDVVQSILWIEQDGTFKNFGQKWVRKRKVNLTDHISVSNFFEDHIARVMEKVACGVK